jgi:hypothetical protein
VIDWSAVEVWPLAAAIRRSAWAYPALETVHIAAFASLVGALLLLELRVFGAQPALPLPALGRLAARTAVTAFVVAAGSGALLFMTDAAHIRANPAFEAKLVLILMAGVNALVFHLRHSLRRHDAVARAQAALSLVLWFSVIAAGRAIAYV